MGKKQVLNIEARALNANISSIIWYVVCDQLPKMDQAATPLAKAVSISLGPMPKTRLRQRFSVELSK